MIGARPVVGACQQCLFVGDGKFVVHQIGLGVPVHARAGFFQADKVQPFGVKINLIVVEDDFNVQPLAAALFQNIENTGVGKPTNGDL